MNIYKAQSKGQIINVYPRADSGGKRLLADLEKFLKEVEKTGGRRDGTVLCNSEVRKY